MATPSIWFQPFTRQNARLVDIIMALDNAGIPLAALHLGDTPAGPGILFLDNFTPLEVLGQWFESLPAAGAVKLMAVSLNPLPTSYTWYLLKGGVTEVFSWYEVENPVQIVAGDFSIPFANRRAKAKKGVWAQPEGVTPETGFVWAAERAGRRNPFRPGFPPADTTLARPGE